MTLSQTISASPLVAVAAAIRDVVQDPVLEIDPATRLEDLPNWDSMRHVALIAELEARFGIVFRLDEIECQETVGDLVETVSVRLAG